MSMNVKTVIAELAADRAPSRKLAIRGSLRGPSITAGELLSLNKDTAKHNRPRRTWILKSLPAGDGPIKVECWKAKQIDKGRIMWHNSRII